MSERKKGQKMKADKRYLGDSVYAEFDGMELSLYLDNGTGPHNRIVLEPAVFAALQEFVDDCQHDSLSDKENNA